MESLDGIKQPMDKMVEYQEYQRNPVGFMLLTGKNGRGKSYIARAFYNYFLHPFVPPARDWDRAFFANQADLNMLWHARSKEYENNMVFISEIKDSKLLVIDDLGTRKPSDAFQDFLYALIDYRYENREKLGTIITTNLDSSAMSTMFGDAILSRVASGIVHQFRDGEDRRIKKF